MLAFLPALLECEDTLPEIIILLFAVSFLFRFLLLIGFFCLSD